MSDDKWITVKEASRLLALHPSSIRRLAKKYHLKQKYGKAKRDKKLLLFRFEIEQLKQSREQESGKLSKLDKQVISYEAFKVIKDELKELKSRQAQVSNIIEELIKYKMAYEDIKAQFTELQERYDISIYKLGYLEARNKELEQQSKGLLTRIEERVKNK